MIEINKLKQTCDCCPSQWEFYTFEHRPVYVRYRWGSLTISIGEPYETVTGAVRGAIIVDKNVGGLFDGKMAWEYVEKELNKLTKKEVLSIVKEEGFRWKE